MSDALDVHDEAAPSAEHRDATVSEPVAIRIRRLDKKETTGDFSNTSGN